MNESSKALDLYYLKHMVNTYLYHMFESAHAEDYHHALFYQLLLLTYQDEVKDFYNSMTDKEHQEHADMFMIAITGRGLYGYL